MGQAKILSPSKLIIGLIYKSDAVKDNVVVILQRKLGRIDSYSPILNFNYTDYYYSEMGKPLKRAFVSFEKLLGEEKLADIKLYTNRLETKFCIRGRRRINIDPGMLNLAKLILATTKDYSHRVYLNRGIFAEVTLFYRNGFRPWLWTYPDYRSEEYIKIFNSIRDIYISQIRDVPKLSKCISERKPSGSRR